MTLRSLTSTSVPLTYALPDYVAIHQRVFGFQQAKMSRLGIQWTRDSFLSQYLEVKANRENDKEEKEVVPLWDHKIRSREICSYRVQLVSFFAAVCRIIRGNS